MTGALRVESNTRQDGGGDVQEARFSGRPGYWEIVLLIAFIVLMLVALPIVAPQSSGNIFTHMGYGL